MDIVKEFKRERESTQPIVKSWQVRPCSIFGRDLPGALLLGVRKSLPYWDFIRAIWASVADTAIAPLQDLLGLGNEAIMNRPATTDGNWQWRYIDGDLTDEIAVRLRELTEVYAR